MTLVPVVMNWFLLQGALLTSTTGTRTKLNIRLDKHFNPKLIIDLGFGECKIRTFGAYYK
jgi:hypothetical protein